MRRFAKEVFERLRNGMDESDESRPFRFGLVSFKNNLLKYMGGLVADRLFYYTKQIL